MRIRSFIIAYALVLAIILFADRRHSPAPGENRYSHVVDLTSNGSNTGVEGAPLKPSFGLSGLTANPAAQENSATRIIAPGSIIPGTWTAAQIPPERLIAPLVVMDLNVAPPVQISLDDIAAWETEHGTIPQGAVVAIRRTSTGRVPQVSRFSKSGIIQQRVPHPSGAWVGSSTSVTEPAASFPITDQAAQFLMDARYTTGFAIDESPDLQSDRILARQIALHGNYVVEGASHLAAIPPTGSLIIVAPAKTPPPSNTTRSNIRATGVRVLAMVR